jgi:DNA-binding transcriptional ArsR family regulator
MTSPQPADKQHDQHDQPAEGVVTADDRERRRRIRELSDPTDMRALAHPTRLALLEMLGVHGELTATQAAALVGESPSSCSFHLRTLAKHGFVEEAGGGHGRQRPWRLAHLGTSIPSFEGRDTEATVAADALKSMFTDRHWARFRQWRDRRHDEPKEWQHTATTSEMVAWATPEEIRALNVAAMEVMDRFRDRLLDPALRPRGSRPFELLYFAYPVEEWETKADGSKADGTDPDLTNPDEA